MAKRKIDFLSVLRKIKNNKLSSKLSSHYDGVLEKKGIDPKDPSAKNAKRATFAGVTLIIVCMMFLLLMFVIFGNGISPVKVYDFFREVNAMGEIGEGEREEISYSLPTRNQSFSEFKRGFIVASDREISVFNKAGYATMSEQMTYSNPQIVTSDETFLVYDLGGRGFTLFNSFEDIYIESREYPISAAAMATDGRFAISASSAIYNTEVVFYDESGESLFAYMRSDYTVDMKYSPSGKYLALVTLDASEGEYIYTLTVLSTKNGKVVSHVTRSGRLPYSCYFMEGDRIALICSDAVIVYNSKCEKVDDYEYPSGQLYRVDASKEFIALMFIKDKVNMNSTVRILDSKGEEQVDFEMYGEYSDMVISSRYVYFASEDGVYRLNIHSPKLQFFELNATNGRILILDGSRVMLCRPNMAYIIDSWS